MTAVWVLLVGIAILAGGGLLALTVIAYVGRAVTRDRVKRSRVRIPPARVVKTDHS